MQIMVKYVLYYFVIIVEMLLTGNGGWCLEGSEFMITFAAKR